MATVLLPAEVDCYSGEHRFNVALDIANEIFVPKIDIHDLVEAWQQAEAAIVPAIVPADWSREFV